MIHTDRLPRDDLENALPTSSICKVKLEENTKRPRGERREGRERRGKRGERGEREREREKRERKERREINEIKFSCAV